MTTHQPLPDVEQIRGLGFSIVIGEQYCLRRSNGEKFLPRQSVMIGVWHYRAGAIRNILAEALESELKADIDQDRKHKRTQLKASMSKDRRPARRPPRRRGKQRRDGSDDPLELKGRDHTWPR